MANRTKKQMAMAEAKREARRVAQAEKVRAATERVLEQIKQREADELKRRQLADDAMYAAQEAQQKKIIEQERGLPLAERQVRKASRLEQNMRVASAIGFLAGLGHMPSANRAGMAVDLGAKLLESATRQPPRKKQW